MDDIAKKRAAALDFVFKDEGGYVERPTEGGGAGNMGVSFTTFQEWRKSQGLPPPTWADLKAMTKEEAGRIYGAKFFDPIHFDEMPLGVGYCVYDASVTGGPGGSLKILNKALGLPLLGSLWTPVTRWAVNHRDVPWLIGRLCDLRIETYRTFKLWPVVANAKGRTWGDIWTTRTNEVRKRALTMVGAYVVTDAPVVTGAPAAPIASPPATPPAPAAATPADKPEPAPAPAFPSAIAILNPSFIEPATSRWKGTVGAGFTIPEFRRYLGQRKFTTWRPQGIVLHNTDHPQLHSYSRKVKGELRQYEGWYETKGGGPVQRLKNIAHGYRTRGWKSGPHLFVDDERIWVFTPLETSGTHSPSYNGTHWALEMVGNFSLEAFNPKIRDMTVAALAIMCEARGLSPDTIIRHGSDPRTSHSDCPGKNVDIADIRKRVRAAMAEGADGDHEIDDDAA
jgi:lysozyme family protein